MDIGLGISLASASRGAGAGTSYSAEATALFARMTSQPNATRKGLIDNLIASLKSAGIWAKLDVFYMRAAHDAQASLLNWTSSSFTTTLTNLTAGADFTVDRGWLTNGTTSFLDTTFNPRTNGVNYTQNSASFGARNLAVNDNASSGFGAFDGTQGMTIAPKNSANANLRVNNNTLANITCGSSANVFQVSRSASNAYDITINGTVTGGAAASTNTPTSTIKEGAIQSAATRIVQLAWLYAGGDLTQTEETNLRNACATFTTALGF
jgi:hypothetical protein